MEPARILVTGASGFVAGHLLPRLRLAFPAAVLTAWGAAAESPDITDAALVDQQVAAASPDLCIHLAAVSAVPAARRDPDHAWEVNLRGTLNLARALLRRRPDCLLLFVSTAEIYGRSFAGGVAVDEAAPAAPMNTYAATKAAADLALGAMVAEGLRVVRLRPFNHTGPGQSPSFAVPAFARQIARIGAGLQPAELVVGALDPARDFLDVRDVCDAYMACVRQADALPPGSILNIAAGRPTRIGDMLDRMLQLAGIAATIRSDPALVRPTEIPTAYGNAARARDLLGWSPTIPWDTTLGDVLADWRARIGASSEA